MNRWIFSFELDGKTVLGFDTGLHAQAFAQAKTARFISQGGSIVYPDGRIENWQAGGTAEHCADKQRCVDGTMVIWGPQFSGEELSEIINDTERRDEALDAIRFWLRARMLIEENPTPGKDSPFPGPAGALIVTSTTHGNNGKSPGAQYPEGTVFFPPAWLVKRCYATQRCLNAEEDALNAERWSHPDLAGAAAISFSAGAMLYSVFCGAPPFPRDNLDELRQDIREGVFVPPNLAAPGLEPELAGLISRAMSRKAGSKEAESRPSPDLIGDFIGPPSSRSVSIATGTDAWIKTLSDEEISKIRVEQEQYSRKKALSVKTRRFVIRNTTIITVLLIVLAVLMLLVQGTIRQRSELPSTRGMSPVGVAVAYYDAFGELDHTMMQACVINKTGREDVDMVMNLFVISKVRQAYEMTTDSFISARDWIEDGRPATDKMVFGITDLAVKVLSENQMEASLEANYILWMPGTDSGEDNTREAPALPEGRLTRDRLELVFQKNAWRISGIERTTRGYNGTRSRME